MTVDQFASYFYVLLQSWYGVLFYWLLLFVGISVKHKWWIVLIPACLDTLQIIRSIQTFSSQQISSWYLLQRHLRLGRIPLLGGIITIQEERVFVIVGLRIELILLIIERGDVLSGYLGNEELSTWNILLFTPNP